MAVRSVFHFLFSRPRLAESRQIYYFFPVPSSAAYSLRLGIS